jgi:Urocanase Rossmann-like domain
MTVQLNPDQAQSRILRTFTTLHQLRSTWGGSLTLSLGLNPSGAALSIAANIAGAVSLAIDDNLTHLHEVVRIGACDFVVNSLDEAIRAMKNEVRKRAPLSVALQADPFLTLKEILDRGLSPQLFSTFLPPSDLTPQQTSTFLLAVHQFQSQGASLVDFSSGESTPQPAPFTPSDTLLIPLLAERHWTLHSFPFDTPAGLRTFDSHALSVLSPQETLRRRWLEAAPRILQRERPPQRTLWLAPSEAEALLPQHNSV